MQKGSCLCGAVTYVVHGEMSNAVFCHCERCRKASGSAFATNAVVDESAFEVAEGSDAIKVFSTAAGVHRWFCAHCGSPLISKRDALPGVVRLRMGTLDGASAPVRPAAHIFTASKADWYDIQDTLPQFAERPTP